MLRSFSILILIGVLGIATTPASANPGDDCSFGPGYMQYGPAYMQYGPAYMQYGPAYMQYGPDYMQYGPAYMQYGPAYMQYGPDYMQYGPDFSFGPSSMNGQYRRVGCYGWRYNSR
jgi:hypothetical protein